VSEEHQVDSGRFLQVFTGFQMTDQMNPSSLLLEDAARLLTKAGGREITVQDLQDDIEAGAPTNPDGTINLVHYTAWNVQRYSQRNDGY
jgi:hypothetical protein